MIMKSAPNGSENIQKTYTSLLLPIMFPARDFTSMVSKQPRESMYHFDHHSSWTHSLCKTFLER